MRRVDVHTQNEACAVLRRISVDPYGISAMAPKMRHFNVLIEDQPCRVANILKQEMLSLGGDAAVARGAVACSIEKTDVLLMGTARQLTALAEKLTKQPFGLSTMAKSILAIIQSSNPTPFTLKTARRAIDINGRTLIMGILNVTPDSFSDGNRFLGLDQACDHALRMIDDGVDIIDIGGESTRPGSEPVTEEAELKRVIPVIDALCAKADIPISIDTQKAKVARAAIEAGAEIVNDISSLHHDPAMRDVVKQAKAALILMHMRGTPRTMQTGSLTYQDLMGEITAYLSAASEMAIGEGVSRESIIVDPGIGFGKSVDDNFKILKKLSELKGLGFPILVGPSRKSFIGKVTSDDPANRTYGTAATVAAAILKGCNIVRVHDVAAIKDVARVTDAILRVGEDAA